MLDATRIASRLWMGSRPPRGHEVAEACFDVLVLCAAEIQPRSREFPGLPVVIHAPLDDDALTEKEADVALDAACRLADLHRMGQRCLVTCAAGRNRSGLVTALALHQITGAPMPHVVRHIQRVRVGIDGEPALSNPSFVTFLDRIRLAC